MSTASPPAPTTISIYQAHFGTPPGSQDPKAECERWERLCAELLAERERLRTELDNVRLEAISAEWERKPIPAMAEVYANVDQSTTLQQVVADLKRELEAEQ